jgi:GT2 family glycosyltransferase
MWIEAKIPYEPGKQLAFAYNRAMETSSADWVLLLDQDVSLVNPRWYDICISAITKLKGTDAGMIVCKTSGKARGIQQISLENSSDLEQHIFIANDLYKREGNDIEQISIEPTGFFMLVKKSVWEKVKFNDMGRGCDKIDRDFASRLMMKGYTIWLLKGLYCYHRRNLRRLKF